MGGVATDSTTGTRPDGPPAQAAPSRVRPPPAIRPFHLVLVGLAALVMACLLLRPWPLDRPMVYSGDAIQHYVLIESADWSGTPGRSPRLAAPDGLEWSAFPTGTERLHLVSLHALSALTGSPFTAANLYVLIGLTVTAVVGFAVMRWMGVGAVMAAAAALAFALSPGFSERLNAGHLFLFALFPVPLGVYLVLWSSARSRTWWPLGREMVVPAVAAAAVALSSAYYAAYTVILVLLLGLVVAIRVGEVRRLVAPVVTAAVIGVVAGVSLLPQLLERAGDPTASALDRPVADAERYALRLTDMLLPRPDHPIGFLATWAERASSSTGPGDRGAVLGLAVVLGLLWMALTTVRRAGQSRDATDRTVVRLSVLVGLAIATATVGGLGYVLATVGFTQIRVWSRMAAFVAFAGLAGLALLAQRRLGPRWSASPLVLAVALLALLDQGLVMPARAEIAAAQREDMSLVEGMGSRLGSGASVIQLPVVPFPDDEGAERLLAPSLYPGGLLFSAGSFRGGPGDWQQTWSQQSPERMAKEAAAAGFDALLIQRTHRLVEDPGELEAGIESVAGPPAGRSPTWVWFDLRPLRAELDGRFGAAAVRATGRKVTRPIGVSYEDTLVQVTGSRYLGEDGAIVLHRLDQDRSAVDLTVRVFAPAGAAVVVGQGEEARRVVPSQDGQVVALRIRPERRSTRVPVRLERTVSGGVVEGDVRVADVQVLDPSLAEDPVLD